MYRVTKTYGNDKGLSCAFRQWRAESHCRLIHGYSLGFKLTFEAQTLDKRNWVYDFGNMKFIKKFLEKNFDHVLMIASDDPKRDQLQDLNDDVANVKVLKNVGCEAFAEYVFSYVWSKIDHETRGRVRLVSVECFEHGANSAIYGRRL
tara:strand:- start:699 stop:1142 length:444 start_codon:yes stop_codon:yes gene_type:complete